MLLKDDSASLETLHNFYRDKEKLAADIKCFNELHFHDKLLQLTFRKRIGHITKINIQKNRAGFSKTEIEKNYYWSNTCARKFLTLIRGRFWSGTWRRSGARMCK
jgi:hypothetical protein